MTDIIAEIDELRDLPIAALETRYAELFGRPPRSKNRTHMFKRCAWKLQERRYGGLSKVAKSRLEELMAEIDIIGPQEQPSRRRSKPGGVSAGIVLVRAWRGTEVRATALVDGGFEHDGVTYRSLSAIAKHVTGSHWNGRLFFGLTERKRK